MGWFQLSVTIGSVAGATIGGVAADHCASIGGKGGRLLSAVAFQLLFSLAIVSFGLTIDHFVILAAMSQVIGEACFNATR